MDDRPTQRGNGSALHYTIHPDGFLTYRVVGSHQHAFRPPLGTVVVEDFCPITTKRTRSYCRRSWCWKCSIASRSTWPLMIRYRSAVDADIVLEVTDPLGLAGGTFALQTRDGAGKCTPHDGSPDVRIGLADLATIYMGAHRACQLARADRITEVREGALGELDAAFSTDRTPYTGTVL